MVLWTCEKYEGPRSAVGGCTTPGSRVDSWWNSGSYSPSISSPGPPRIDEGPQTENSHFQFNSLPQQRVHSSLYQNHQLQSHLNSPYTTHQRHREPIHLQDQSHHHQPASRTSEASFTNASAPIPSANFEFVDTTIISRNSNNVCSDPSNPYNLISSSVLPLNNARPYHNKIPISNHLSINLNASSETTETSSVSSEPSPPRRNSVLSSLLNNNSIARSISPPTSCTSASPDSLNGLLSTLNVKIKSESCEERSSLRTPSNSFNNSLLSSILSNSRNLSKKRKRSVLGNRGNNEDVENNNQSGHNEDISIEEHYPVKIEYSSSNPNSPNQILKEDRGQQQFGGISDKNSISSCCDISTRIANTDIAIDMKFESQTGLPTPPSHLTSAGVEPPHSNQGSQGIVVNEVEGVESILLSPWGSAGNDFLEPQDVKQNAAGLQDAWDTLLLGTTVGVATPQSLAELKPLPPFTGYTGHLSINGIPGHHYHTIASSAQRPSLQSTSPTSSSNQEYYESSVVSSSTPCPQASQKQHHHQSHQHHHHSHHQQQQQLPQSTQQPVDYDIEDIAEIIGSAIADTTVPGGGGPGNAGSGTADNSGSAGGGSGNNGPGSEHDPDASRDWIDIAEWIETACSPKAQETNSPSPYSQIYAPAPTTTATNPAPQHQSHGSTLQSLLTHGYSPLLHARLQATGNVGLPNSSCGETPSSTSPYPPVSPPGRVSTSCSPDHMLHSSFGTPSHTRKRPRPAGGSQNPSKKSLSTATAHSYGTDSNLITGKEKPLHRCSICNRGFLNKSNIKVHLRTHTGEKPFRCEVCGKSFRQKAHLIKHQQIHKRIGRD